MTETSAPATGICLRCRRILRSPASIAAGYGPICAAKVRARAKAAAAAADAKPEQVAKAVELIETGGLVPLRRHIYLVVASNGVDRYRTAPQACNCPAGLKGRHPCYHRLAAALVAAA